MLPRYRQLQGTRINPKDVLISKMFSYNREFREPKANTGVGVITQEKVELPGSQGAARVVVTYAAINLVPLEPQVIYGVSAGIFAGKYDTALTGSEVSHATGIPIAVTGFMVYGNAAGTEIASILTYRSGPKFWPYVLDRDQDGKFYVTLALKSSQGLGLTLPQSSHMAMRYLVFRRRSEIPGGMRAPVQMVRREF